VRSRSLKVRSFLNSFNGRYYAGSGFVDLRPVTLPGPYPNSAAAQWLLFKYRYIYHTALESVVRRRSTQASDLALPCAPWPT